MNSLPFLADQQAKSVRKDWRGRERQIGYHEGNVAASHLHLASRKMRTPVGKKTTMRIVLTIGCLLLGWDCPACLAGEPPRTSRKAELNGSSVQAVLREACQLAMKQDKQHYWTEYLLLDIGDVQIRAGDFDGALRSIRGSTYPSGRNEALVRLAKALARDGKRKRAFDVLRMLDADHGWRQDSLDDGVQLRWIEYLIASGDLGRAGKAIDQLKTAEHRSEALRILAVSFAKADQAARAAKHFTLAIKAVSGLKDDFNHARAL
jgi:hypothetical protein